MLPLLPFAAGLFAGAAAIGLLRSERARVALDRTQHKLRSAGKSGLAAVGPAPAATAQGTPAASAAKPRPARKAARRTPAAKPATPRGGTRKPAKAKIGTAT